MTFSEQLKADIALVEPALEKYLSRETGEGYDRIFEAAKYSAMAGGKRLRPVIDRRRCIRRCRCACRYRGVPDRSGGFRARLR